jgi:hypothetical protein
LLLNSDDELRLLLPLLNDERRLDDEDEEKLFLPLPYVAASAISEVVNPIRNKLVNASTTKRERHFIDMGALFASLARTSMENFHAGSNVGKRRRTQRARRNSNRRFPQISADDSFQNIRAFLHSTVVRKNCQSGADCGSVVDYGKCLAAAIGRCGQLGETEQRRGASSILMSASLLRAAFSSRPSRPS